MTIQVRLLAQQALRDLRALQAELRRTGMAAGAASGAGGAGAAAAARTATATKGLTTATTAATAATSKLGSTGVNSFTRWGNQVQWAGRQLQYNFSIPIAIATGAAMKFALDNEAAMVRVKKVYGDSQHQASDLKDEVDALGRAFEALSNLFGVNQAAVIGVAGDWAAAGASGIQLAKAVRLTLETMILGEIDAAKATEALIAIQAQYGLTVDELATSIDTLNMVENETGATMAGLIDSLSRAAGVARSAGIDVQHLAAFTAALVPAAGTAATAGNGLRTIISRLLSPTKEAGELLNLMGLEVDKVGWNSLNGGQRIELLGKRFAELGDAQRMSVSETVASRWQINRFNILMQDVVQTGGYYQRALRASADATANFNQKVSELNQVLTSNPQQLKQVWVILQNAMAKVVVPMVPYITYLARQIVLLFEKFQNLPPEVQKLTGFLALFLLLLGPIARYVGSVSVMFGLLHGAFLGVSRSFINVMKGFYLLAAWPFKMVIGGLGLVGRGVQLLGASFLGAMPGIMGASGKTAATVARDTRVMSKAMGDAAWKIKTANMVAGDGFIITSMQADTAAKRIAASGGIFGVTGDYIRTKMGQASGALNWFAGEMGTKFPATMARAAETSTMGAAAMAAGFAAGLSAMPGEAIAAGTAVIGVLGTMTAPFFEAGTAVGLAFGSGVVAGSRAQLFGELFREALLAFSRIPQIAAAEGTATGLAWVQATGTAIVTASKALVIAGAQAAQAVNIGFISAQAIGVGAYTGAGARAGGSFAVALIGTAPAAAAAGTVVGATGAAAASTAALTGMAALRAKLLVGIAALGRGMLALFGGILISLSKLVLAGVLAIGRFLIGPWGLAIAAAVALFFAFKDDIARIWNNIVDAFRENGRWIIDGFSPVVTFFQKAIGAIARAFNNLPDAIKNPIMAVVNFVRSAALQVYEWFTYLNPFAKHSPSLVDQVTRGMAVIASEYGKVASAGSPFARAAADIERFKTAVGDLGLDEWASERADVSVMAPGAVDEFDALVATLKVLNGILEQQKNAVDAQQAVVDQWKTSLDQANNAIDVQQRTLDVLGQQLDSITDQYDAHKAAMDDFASAGIQGQKAMSNAIFENEMAQKGLRLEIMRLEDAGGSVDDLRDRLANLQGDIESLRGDANDLRASGAGSDVLGPITGEIQAMEAQYKALSQSANSLPINDLQNQLADLQRQGEILDLENALQFDPLIRQVDDLVNGMRELPFDQILTGVSQERAAMDALKPALDAATAAHVAQQAVVDQMKISRDALQASYDVENAKLQTLQDQYSKTADAIGEVEQALRMVTAAGQAAGAAGGAGAMSDAANKFNDLAGADFTDVGGTASIGNRTDWASQQAEIDALTQAWTDETADLFGKVDMFGPLKEKWDAFKGWWTSNVVPAWDGMVNGLKRTGITLGDALNTDTWGENIGNAWGSIQEWWDKVVGVYDWLKGLFGPQIEEIWNRIVEAVVPVFNDLKAQFAAFAPLLEPMKTALMNLWNIVLKPLFAWIGANLISGLSVVFSVIGNIIGPIIETIGTVIGAIVQFIRGLVEIFTGLFTGDMKMVLDGFVTMWSAVWTAVWGIVEGAWDILYGIVSGIVEGIVDFFQWLWDTVVGEKVMGMVNAIIDWFQDLWTRGVAIVKGLVEDVSKWFSDLKTSIVDKVIEIRDNVLEWFGNLKQGAIDKFIEIRDGIMDKVNWLRDNASLAFTTLRDNILGAFQWVKDKIEGIMTGITDFIKSGINGGITAVNKLIEGLNKVADVLPGLDWNISSIPLLSRGGAIPTKRVGGGFETNGARAIVGEGKQNYPEFVIPTDPAHRKRAAELYATLGKKIGVASDGPEWGIGSGPVDFIKNAIGNGANLAAQSMDWIKDAAAGAVSTIFGPIKDAASGMIGGIPWQYGRDVAQAGLDQVWNWVTNADESYRQAANETGGNGPWRRPVSDYVKSSGYGMRVNPVTGINTLHAGVDLAAAMGKEIFAAAQGTVSRYTGASGLGNHVKVDHGNGLSTVYGHMSAFAGALGNVNAGGLIGRVGSTGNSTGPHLHFEIRRSGISTDPIPWMASKGVPLGSGGIVRSRFGGTLANIGEAGRDEAVIPLPSGWESALSTARGMQSVSRLSTMTVQRLVIEGSVESTSLQPVNHTEIKNYTFYGNLEFPNITDGSDAKDFIRNLDDLAGGR